MRATVCKQCAATMPHVERALLYVRGMQSDVVMRRARPARLRIAVVGQGHFAQAAVLPAIEQLDDIELTALVSGSDDWVREMGDRYGVRTLARYSEFYPL